jgi:tocopherol O-methyltransferase
LNECKLVLNQKIMEQSTRFYEENYPDFFGGWSEDHFHYGLWYVDTASHEDSLINHSKLVAEKLNIQPGNRVLDAGCGTGGTSRYIAENYDVSVEGILLSPSLLEKARELSARSLRGNRISFFIKDYTDTGYEDESFDRIFAIESQCHAVAKEKFIAEAHRILKPGGRLVVSDFFLYREPGNEEERQYLQEWCDGWAMPPLVIHSEYESFLKKKFIKPIRIDNTPYVLKSASIMKDQARERMPINFILHHQGQLPETRLSHVLATYRQGDCMERGIWGHMMFVADKI